MGGKFKGWRMSVADDAHYALLLTLTCVEVKGQIRQRIRENRRFSIYETVYLE
jgi:hypothetical protein